MAYDFVLSKSYTYGGYFYNQSWLICSGGTAIKFHLLSRGYLHVSSGGSAIDATIDSGCRIYVSSGGSVFNTIVNSKGGLYVYNGGKANSTTVNSRGEFYVSSGGTANNTIVNSRGQLHVASGGTAFSIIENGGYVFVVNGAMVTFTPNTISGLVLSDEIATIHSGTTANKTTLNSSGGLEIYSGGVVNSTKINSNGKLCVSGIANDTIVNALGIIEVSSGGTANGTTVNFNGKVYVSSGGTANNTTISNGWFYVSNGAQVNSTTVNSGGRVYASSGGSMINTIVNSGGLLYIYRGCNVNRITEDGGYVDVADGVDVIFEPNTISGLILSNAATATIHSGTTANSTTLNSMGGLEVSSGGLVTNTTVNANGRFIVRSNGTANVTNVNSGGLMYVYSDCIANGIIENGGFVNVEEGAKAVFEQNIISELVLSNSSATLHSGTTAYSTTINASGGLVVYNRGTANSTTINTDGCLYISSGGTVSNTAVNEWGSMFVSSSGMADNTTVSSDGCLYVSEGGLVNNTTVNNCGWLCVSGTANSTTIKNNGRLYVSGTGKLTGRMIFENGAIVSAYVGSILDFDLTQTSTDTAALVNDLSVIQGIPFYTLTISETQKKGDYLLAEGAKDFNSSITVRYSKGAPLGILTVGDTLIIGETDYTLNLTDSVLSLVVHSEGPELDVIPQTQTWEKIADTAQYVVEYSTDNFEHVIRLAVDSNSLDSFQMPTGNYQWRVKSEDSEDWTVGEPVTATATDNEPKLVKSDADGNADVFFAKSIGTWESGYVAQHVGSINDWTGTNEYASVYDKNKLADIIEGSTDANILLMTDDEKGDALFVDDIYTDLPGSVAEQQSRIAKINEIRAGAGDDIVDMTSQRFEYIGEGLTIRGGEGNDTIWANKGDNLLFGDAGNDRIVGASGNDVIAGGIGNDRLHGGGGEDVFTFCDNWGSDNVEQLSGGSVTLWFTSGSEANWNAETLTYSDGTNSVKVSGVSEVTLKFGDDGSAQFATLTNMGAFFDATTERIFEESGKGILASL